MFVGWTSQCDEGNNEGMVVMMDSSGVAGGSFVLRMCEGKGMVVVVVVVRCVF